MQSTLSVTQSRSTVSMFGIFGPRHSNFAGQSAAWGAILTPSVFLRSTCAQAGCARRSRAADQASAVVFEKGGPVGGTKSPPACGEAALDLDLLDALGGFAHAGLVGAQRE